MDSTENKKPGSEAVVREITRRTKKCHESINNLIPKDVFFGRDREIITRRERIKKRTMALRRIYNLKNNRKKEEKTETESSNIKLEKIKTIY